MRLGNFVMAHTERPFLIAGGTMVPALPEDGSFPTLMPVEYTPLYVGVRQTFGGFGGGYVDPFAYDPPTAAANARQNDEGVFDIEFDPAHRFTLADVAASTGAPRPNG